MPRVINDSDDEAELEYSIDQVVKTNSHDDLAQADQNDKPAEQRTQSTGSTDRMLKHAHALMMDSVTPDVGDRATCETPLRNRSSQSHQSLSSSKLKRSKSAAIGQEEHGSKKRQKHESRRDDWDLPPSSSPSKTLSRKTVSPGEQPTVIITDAGSTIMDNTSSDERRAQELQDHTTTAADSMITFDDRQPSVGDDGSRDTNEFGDCIVLAPSKSRQSQSQSRVTNETVAVACKPRKEKRKRETSTQPNLGNDEADELATGMPKERYQPRPSRSRSHQLSGLSPHPHEDGVQRNPKSKRRKTVDVVNAEKTAELQNIGFTNSQATRALRETDGNVELAADALLRTTEQGGKENAPRTELREPIAKTESTRSRGRPEKIPVVPEDAHTYQEDRGNEEARHEQTSDPHHDHTGVTRDESRQALEPREMVSEKGINGAPEGDCNRDAEGASKRRGRGRPKKQDSKETPENVSNPVKENPDGHDSEAVENETPHQRPPVAHEDDISPSLDMRSTPATASDVKAANEDAKARGEQTELQKAPTTPSKTSPLKNGKVPLRVGLSKRMKIPSLLQSARKTTN